MKDAKMRKGGRSSTLAGARTGLFRASLLLGSLLGALMLIAVPDGDRHSRLFADGSDDVDMTATGSIAGHGLAAARRLPVGSGPCLMFPDGTQRGDCR